jgi:hypothetical protein
VPPQQHVLLHTHASHQFPFLDYVSKFVMQHVWLCLRFCRLQELELQPTPLIQQHAATQQQQQQQQQQSPRSSSEDTAAVHQLEEQQEQQPEQPHANGVAVAADDSAVGRSSRLLQELQFSYAALQAAVAAAADASVEVSHVSSSAIVRWDNNKMQFLLISSFAVLSQHSLGWPEPALQQLCQCDIPLMVDCLRQACCCTCLPRAQSPFLLCKASLLLCWQPMFCCCALECTRQVHSQELQIASVQQQQLDQPPSTAAAPPSTQQQDTSSTAAAPAAPPQQQQQQQAAAVEPAGPPPDVVKRYREFTMQLEERCRAAERTASLSAARVASLEESLAAAQASLAAAQQRGAQAAAAARQQVRALAVLLRNSAPAKVLRGSMRGALQCIAAAHLDLLTLTAVRHAVPHLSSPAGRLCAGNVSG